jgi:hypothetical protein
MDMIRHDVTFLYQALLLLRQPVKYATQLLPIQLSTSEHDPSMPSLAMQCRAKFGR